MSNRFAAAALCAALLAACAPPAKDAVVSGQFTADQPGPLPAGSVAHVVVSDTSAIDEPPTKLAQQDIPAPALPLAFSLTVPAAKMTQGVALSVSARITNGDSVLYLSPEANAVAPVTPAAVRLAAATPVPLPYNCGEDAFSITFTNDIAQVAIGKAAPVAFLRAPPAPGAPADLKTYTNGKMTFFRKGVELTFSRGGAAPVPCTIRG